MSAQPALLRPWHTITDDDGDVFFCTEPDGGVSRILFRCREGERFRGQSPDMFRDIVRLLRAAPALLEALRAVELARMSDSPEQWQRATGLTDAAIAKAEGRS